MGNNPSLEEQVNSQLHLKKEQKRLQSNWNRKVRSWTKEVIVPPETEFCSLTYTVCREKHYNDPNCFLSKAEGCEIYQEHMKKERK